jgi:penicillin amidase
LRRRWLAVGSVSRGLAGVSFAGLPGIILGQNEHIAWGATTTYFDMADVYQETLAAEGTATR